MGSHPINLAFRFLLELCALAAFAFWAWECFEGILKPILSIILPVSAATIWGVFNVPKDPSRSGKAPIPVPGWLRLIIELAIYGLAILPLFNLGKEPVALLFLFFVIIHYGLSYDRIVWLLDKRS